MKYKGIEFDMEFAVYGKYRIYGTVGTIKISFHTNDSILYDNFKQDDFNNDEELANHEAAVEKLFNMIKHECEDGLYQYEYLDMDNDCGYEFE